MVEFPPTLFVVVWENEHGLVCLQEDLIGVGLPPKVIINWNFILFTDIAIKIKEVLLH